MTFCSTFTFENLLKITNIIKSEAQMSERSVTLGSHPAPQPIYCETCWRDHSTEPRVFPLPHLFNFLEHQLPQWVQAHLSRGPLAGCSERGLRAAGHTLPLETMMEQRLR